MGATLHGIDIETITHISRIERPNLKSFSLGHQALALSPHTKNMLVQYSVSGTWTQGDADYDSKESKVRNIMDAGLPVWFDASSWRKNAILFGKISEFQCEEDQGAVNVTNYSFLITGVFLWGYIFVQDDGISGIRIYDVDKQVQSTVINPITRKCNFSKTASAISFQIYVKNTQGGAVSAVLEMMVPDAVNEAGITVSAPGAVTELAGAVGTTGFSSVPGTKQRIKLTRSIGASAEELWTITINYSSDKTSYIDGSVDENAA